MRRPAHPGTRTLLVWFVLALTLSAAPATAGYPLLEPYEDGGRDFRELEISDEILVYYHQRTVGEATVEGDQIVYRFDPSTGELIARQSRWRAGVPEVLPVLGLSAEAAAGMVDGDVRFVRLLYIDPESYVFPFEPAPENPCWIVGAVDEHGHMSLTVFDAVDGGYVGQGVPPPYTGYSLTGPWESGPCSGGWVDWMESAASWFETMGYSTEQTLWPTESKVRSHVESGETAVFYELAHGGSSYFASGCLGGQDYDYTFAGEIGSWISGYAEMPFAFIGSCAGMCSVGPGTFAYEFRKGSPDKTTVVGYCGMSEPQCADCWMFSIGWQNTLFSYMAQGMTVKEAFDEAGAAYPECALNDCMRFEGDTTFAIVPVVPRAAGWNDVTEGSVGGSSDSRGVAWGDYDADGLLDLYVSNDGPNVLLRYDGGSFTDVTASPLDDAGDGAGVAWGDYDNDGDADLYLANDGANRLFRNDGGSFTDVTASPLDDAGSGAGVAWVDFDLDGDLDLHLVNRGTANRLFRNDGGGFTDVTASPIDDAGPGSGAAWADYDSDGDPDLYLTNDGSANRLFRNDDGVFVDVTSPPLNDSGSGKGVAWGDYDNDGDLDLYLANDGSANRLFRNDGGTFTDVTDGVLGDVGNGRSTGWADYDKDGDLDLYVANDGANKLLRNDGAGVFVDASTGAAADAGSASGFAWGDYDRDGEVDLYIANDGTNRLLRNDIGNGYAWLTVDLRGVTSNASGVGARVRIVAGGSSQIREVTAGSGLYSEGSLPVEFGLGTGTSVDSLVIRWPLGLVDVESGVPTNQCLVIEESPWDDVSASPIDDAGSGRGVAWGDYDGDGDQDLYLTNYGLANKLFRNDGGSFVDVTVGPLGDDGTGTGAAWADYDNDGDLDLYLGNYGDNKLLRNDGGAFTDVTAGPLAGSGSTNSVAWADYDGDGKVDLFLAQIGSNLLLRNEGGDAFSDASSAPIDDASNARSGAWGDYDDDGDLDLYIVNLGTSNKLFRNDGAGTFVDVTAGPEGHTSTGMAAAWGDYDNDGDLDLYVSNTGSNKLFRNDDGTFADVTAAPLDHAGKGRGIAWADYDNDGDLDLFLSNRLEADRLFRNDGTAFVDATTSVLADTGAGSGAAFADFDGDGAIDLYASNNGEANHLYRNDYTAGRHWLAIDLIGGASNRAAIGARVRVVAGGYSQIREVCGGEGFSSQGSLTSEFGLGTATIADTVEIRWPSGAVDRHTAVAADQRVTYLEGALTEVAGPEVGGLRNVVLRGNFPNPFNPFTWIRYELPGPARVSLRVYGVSGRLVRTLADSEFRRAGSHTAVWDGRDDAGRPCGSGAYFYQLISDGQIRMRKMILLK